MPENYYLDNDYLDEQMPEPDEHQALLLQVANSLGVFAGADFETAFENACYMCDADPDEFDEWDLQNLRDMYK